MVALALTVIIIMTFSVLFTSCFGDGLFYELSEDGSYYIVAGVISDATEFNIPQTHRNRPVKAIGNGAFSECDNITKITIPEGVTTIEQYAFASCVDLESIELPSTLETIEDYAFENCTSLKSIEIPESVKEVSHTSFAGANQLKEKD